MSTSEIFSVKKGFAPILILCLIAAILTLAGAFYLKQIQKLQTVSPTHIPKTSKNTSASPSAKPDSTSSVDTANWKTYTNTKRGFTIKYPPNLFIIPGQVDEFVILSDKTTTDWSSAEGVKMQISILANPKNLSIEDYFNSLPKIPTTHPRTTTYKQTTINGNEAVISTVTGCEEWEGCDPNKPSYEKYIKGNTYIIRFNTDFWEDPWVNMFFSTFKFTN